MQLSILDYSPIFEDRKMHLIIVLISRVMLKI